MSDRVDDVRQRMLSNRLQLNGATIDFIWCALPRCHHHVPSDVQLGPDMVQPVQSAKDLGVFTTMITHINNVLSSCYGSLRQIRNIKRALPVHALNTLVTRLVHSRLDYCNVVFTGLPVCDL